jgi:hypothetical protein
VKYIKIIFLIICLPVFIQAQTPYYFISGTLSTAANWNTARDGSGTALINFTTNNRTYVIQSGQTVTNSAAWSISGTTSKLQIENNATLTASTAVTLSANTTFQVDNGGTYIHNNTTTTSTSIFQGTESFAAGSNVRIDNWSSTATAVTNGVTLPFGNLEINWGSNTGTWQQGWSTAFTLCSGNFTITNTGSGEIAYTTKDAYVVTISGSYNFTGGTIDLGTNNGPNTIGDFNISGDITQTGGTYTRSGNAMFLRLNAVGTGTNTWTFSGGTRLLMLYTVALGKTINLASNFAMGSGVGSTQILLVSGTLDAYTFIISNGTAGQGITNNGTIRTANVNGLAGSGTTTVSNTVPITIYVGTDCTFEYYATGSQTVTAASVYENVIINGSGTKTLAGASTINKTLTLTNGKLDIQNHILTIQTTGGIAAYNSSNYIVTGTGAGRLRQNGVTAANYNSTKFLPVGTASCYLPAAAQPTATSDFSANVFTGATTNGTSGGTAWANKAGMVDAVWNVDRNNDRIAISGTANISLNWNNCYSTLEGTDFVPLPDANIGIWRWVSGTNWSFASANFSSANTDAGSGNYSTTISNAAFNGPYIVADLTNPLANNFIKLEAVPNNNTVDLLWTIQNTGNLKYFELEKSFDAVSFVKFGLVNAGVQTTYSYTDKHAAGNLIYYRLKLFSAEGNYSYSRIVSVSRKNSSRLKLLNNPVQDRLVFYHPQSKAARYRILGTDGKLFIKGNIAIHSSVTTVNLSSLNKGVYLLQFIDGNEIATERIIKQ